MELLRGETLAARLERGPLPAPEAARVAGEVARALAHAHGVGVLHRDLKPSNVFLAADGGVKVVDFGLAHVFGAGGPSGSGTPGHMAPEQQRGEEEDARTDLFALGVLLVQMLSAVPADAERIAGAAEALPGPPALASLARRLLAADRDARPASAEEVLEALEAAAPRGRAAPRDAHPRRRARLPRRSGLLAGLGAATLLSRDAPAGRPVLAVADVDNQTGDAELDELSGMLVAVLEQSRQLRVLSRSRMLLLLEGASTPSLRIDAALGLEAARRARATALVLAIGPAPRRRVCARGARPRSGARRAAIFAFEEHGPDKASLLGQIDRMAERTRGALHDEEAPGGPRCGSRTPSTANFEAYQHYFLGAQCLDRPVHGLEDDCSDHFRRAIALDPAFAAAHYQLAVWAHYYGAPHAEQRAAVARALQTAGRGSPKERLLAQAWAAYLDGRERARALALPARRRDLARRQADLLRGGGPAPAPGPVRGSAALVPRRRSGLTATTAGRSTTSSRRSGSWDDARSSRRA